MEPAGFWEDYRTRTIMISFEGFFSLFLLLLFLTSGAVEPLYLLLVLLVSGYAVKGLKKAAFAVAPGISARPPGARDCHAFPGSGDASSTGMPSGHSAGAFLMAVYAHDFISRQALSAPRKQLASAVVFLFAGAIAYSRTVYQCHTWSQVVAGAVVGAGLGLAAVRVRPTAINAMSAW
jgi:membrane-associated phospholipid phosphatase